MFIVSSSILNCLGVVCTTPSDHDMDVQQTFLIGLEINKNKTYLWMFLKHNVRCKLYLFPVINSNIMY